MRPHHWPFSSCTTSPTRMAPENAICMPANTAPSEVCAARPATTDSTPAEANTVVPMLENAGNVIRIAAMPSTTTTAMASLRSTVTCVRIRRHHAVRVGDLVIAAAVAGDHASLGDQHQAGDQPGQRRDHAGSAECDPPSRARHRPHPRFAAPRSSRRRPSAWHAPACGSARRRRPITPLRRPMRLSTQVSTTPSRYAATTAPAAQAKVTARFVAVSSSFSSGIG